MAAVKQRDQDDENKDVIWNRNLAISTFIVYSKSFAAQNLH